MSKPERVTVTEVPDSGWVNGVRFDIALDGRVLISTSRERTGDLADAIRATIPSLERAHAAGLDEAAKNLRKMADYHRWTHAGSRKNGGPDEDGAHARREIEMLVQARECDERAKQMERLAAERREAVR